MLVEETAVPPAHLMVGFHVTILDIVFLEDLARFFEDLVVNPGGDIPVFFGDQFCREVSLATALKVQVAIPYLHSAFVSARVRFLNSSENGTSLKKVQG